MEKIAKANITGNWFFIGSVGTELQGMKFSWKPNDLDIAGDRDALEKFRKLFGKKGRKKEDDVIFIVDDVIVEFCVKPKKYKFFSKIKRKKGLNTISLEEQVKRYEFAGSLEKARRIREFLEK